MKIKWKLDFKLRNVLAGVVCMALAVSAASGCGNSGENGKTENGAVAGKEGSETKEEQEQKESETEEQEDAEMGFSFADVSNLEFIFASGAGAWCTELYIHEDGTFEGMHHDSDMDTGADYPDGTVYYCNFSGKFTQPEKVDDYTYSMRIENLECEQEEGEVEIMDGVRYIGSYAYGLDDAEELLIYLPGSPLRELPEEYLRWVGYYDLERTTETTLPYYGIYNVTPEYGFSSYVLPEVPEDTDSTEVTENTEVTESKVWVDMDEELAGIEEQAAVLEEALYSNELTQIELNQTSAELYKLWDDELNAIWARLKETLDEESMETLLAEQREWIAAKESAVEAEGAEYGMGTMRALVENDKAAELTKERVYELAELLR